MKVGLFIPCYVDQFYPKVGIASLEILEKQGCQVVYPASQTCCGQPLANSGFESDAKAAYHHFVDTFQGFDYIVAPSGSCVYHVRKHFDVIPQSKAVQHIRERTLDIAEFLLDILNVELASTQFPHRVGLHHSCHGLRGLRLGSSSERMQETESKILKLLQQVQGIQIADLDRVDECCGFGGTFAIQEAAISAKMGKDRIQDHLSSQVEYIVSGDMSCLMHMEGIIKRHKLPLQVKHFVEILNGT